MAHFRAVIQGNRGDASRLGSKQSGMVATCNGWDAGVHVVASHENGADTFRVYATSGSNRRSLSRLVGTVRETPDGPVFKPTPTPSGV